MSDELGPVKKPGYKTTEFWLSAIVTLAGLAMASGIIPTDSVWDKAIGLVVSTLATMGYTKGRSDMKTGQ